MPTETFRQRTLSTRVLNLHEPERNEAEANTWTSKGTEPRALSALRSVRARGSTYALAAERVALSVASDFVSCLKGAS